METKVKFETPWSDRIDNWNKFKPFAAWYHQHIKEIWRYGGNENFRLKLFLLGHVPITYKKLLGTRIRDPQKINKTAVITAIYVPSGKEEDAKVAIKRLGYSSITKEKTLLWKSKI